MFLIIGWKDLLQDCGTTTMTSQLYYVAVTRIRCQVSALCMPAAAMQYAAIGYSRQAHRYPQICDELNYSGSNPSTEYIHRK